MTLDRAQWRQFLDSARAQCATVTDAFVLLKLETTGEHAEAFLAQLRAFKKSADEIGYDKLSLLCVPVEALYKSFLEHDEPIPEDALQSAESTLENMRALLADDQDPPEGIERKPSDVVGGSL